MKRFALLLLAFTMLFVMASAEESFVEEDFAVAASFDDEFFAEETFFGDEFEAEQPEVEGEVEDRSVYLFEDELVHTAKKDPWQDWNINLSVKSLKKNKVTLQWTIDKAYGEASGQRQLVVGTLHKAFEGISGVEPVILFFRDRAAAFVIIIGRLRVDDLQLIFFPEGLDQRFGKKLLVIVDAILIDAAFGSGGLQVDGLLLFAQFDRGQRAEERIHF